MLQNAYLDAKIGFDPAENEPPKECCVAARRAGAHRNHAEVPAPRREQLAPGHQARGLQREAGQAPRAPGREPQTFKPNLKPNLHKIISF